MREARQGNAAAIAAIRREDVAYLAGFFDGEGSVTINHMKRDGGKSDAYTLHVVIGNTDPTVLVWAQSMFGGYLMPRQPRKKQHAPSVQWLIANQWALRFLETIRPYVRMKGGPVDVAINFQRAMRKHGPKRTPPEVIAWREEQRLAIRMMNGRTKRADDPPSIPSTRVSPEVH
jgi:hypothetical protein